MRRQASQSGVTLLEMLVVVSLMALMAAVTMPSMTSGLDSLRINGAASDTVTFLNRALNRAVREQQVMEVSVRMPERTMMLQGSSPGILDQLTLPEGVRILAVYPALPNGQMLSVRQFLLLPGGTVPRIGIDLVNERGMRRFVQVDPVTGVPQILKGSTQQAATSDTLHSGEPQSVTVGGSKDNGMHSAGDTQP